jgi:LysM repeat protein
MGEVEQVDMADPAAYPAPEEGETAVAPPAETAPPVNTISYTVKAGDTLYDIARAYGTTIEEIVAASDSISRPNEVIKPGMVLTIPKP